MSDRLRIAGAQIDLTVGDLGGNERKILEAMAWAEDRDADVLLLPELAVTGYPPEDLVLREGFVTENLAVLDRLAAASASVATVVGFVDRLAFGVIDDDVVKRDVANAAAVLADGAIKGIYHKELLPNYGVFDEARYFAESRDPVRVWMMSGVTTGVSICEDIWSADGPPSAQAASGATVLLNINGSPYHIGKGAERAALLRDEAVRSGAVVAYLNTVGGQDELVFDGDSMVFLPDGTLAYRAAQFTEELFIVDVVVPEPRRPGSEPVAVTAATGTDTVAPDLSIGERLDEDAEIYTALVTGLRDYVHKNGFSDVVVGLSGGIDSALSATLAVDALGPDLVHGITMPSRYSSQGSVTDSRALADNLGCRFDVVPIEPVFTAFLDTLAPLFGETSPGVAEENLQARVRGTLLMAISNKLGGMVVATGNKSEMAVGYATLYGDMAGGFAVLKDVYKTLVYRLSEWRNKQGLVIPRSIIDKPPSAELRPDQLDTDSLPAYDELDPILERYIEDDATVDEIVADGHDRDLVYRIARMVDRNEYKRRQAAPGVRITKKGFGRDRRLPITNHYLR
ncbi:MAG: NAD+ synthase [Acidimicrobiia bacterium]|nr:MAG: NAD+ synthase [Acidimicrobiia bacterium]